MTKKIQKKQNNRAFYLAVAFCIICVVFMIVALLRPQTAAHGEFIPPAFAEDAQQGIPDVPEDLGWFTPQGDGLELKVSVCGEVVIRDGKADMYFTNYEENEAWMKVRILDETGSVLAESDLIRPGEYLQEIEFDTIPQNGQAIFYKVMAYEPETYYSAGSFTLGTTAKIGG